jgi:hypothetical protein
MNDTGMHISNAKKSPRTGPKSVKGKFRASRNAAIHGLSVPQQLTSNEQLCVMRMAQILSGGNKNPDILAAATRVALAQFEVERVRRKRSELDAPKKPTRKYNPDRSRTTGVDMPYSEAILTVDFSSLGHSEQKRIFNRRLPAPLVGAMLRSQRAYKIENAQSLDRYEKRAWSARRTAIKSLDRILADRPKIYDFGETNSKKLLKSYT